MRKLFTSILTVLVLAAAIFTCCGQTQAFASLFASSKTHDCCKKNLPQSSADHQDCQCHHEISIVPSQMDAVKLVQNIVTFFPRLDFIAVDFSSTDHVKASSLYDDGPPIDQPVSETPLYYQTHTLRL